jgi:hypothetical protein
VNATPRQKVLLGVLAFLVLIVLWQLVPTSDDDDGGDTAAPAAAADPESASDGPARPRRLPARRRGAPEKVDQVTELHLADLDIQPRDYTPGRDPWRYYEPPPPGPSPEELARQRAEAERQRLLEEQRRQAELLRQQQELQAQQPPPPPPVPQPPPFPYKYLGNFGPPGHQIAVFSDGKTIINRRQGGTIDGKFVVAQIGYESVDIQFVGFPNTPAQRLAIGR